MKPLFFYRLIEKFHNYGEEWDKLSPSETTAIDFAHRNINPEPERYTDANHYSLEYYLAHYGESINERFRNNRADKDDLATADMVASYITKTPLVLYRGVCKAVFMQMKENANGLTNVDLYEKSFLQTSLVKGCEATSDYHLRIYVPQGTQAVYLGNVNNEQFYYEVDIQYGSKLRIISADKKYINCILL